MKSLYHQILLLLTLILSPIATAWQAVNENAAEPTREFRAAWVATVYNLDWPSRAGLSATAQKAELLSILNAASKLKLNAIVLQIRPNCDALYSSRLEPWSSWLSGAGVNPGYDPLAYAIAEGHRRGIEIHAWFNPFRATIKGRAVGKGHVSQKLSSSLLNAGGTTMLNPSHSQAQQHVLKVIMDVVQRYDIDGIHLDDYFYPYPPNNHVADGRTPAQRRAAIDSFVSNLYRQVKSAKPWVRVGISPFGIWQPGYPAGIEAGVNAYEHLACDARKWIANGWVDYLAPQLYWRSSGPQSFPALMQWWSAINTKRPIWPGIATARINNGESNSMSAAEIGQQIDFTRKYAKQSAGQLLWSWKSVGSNRGGIQSQLQARYTTIAVPPAMPWSGSARPNRPVLSLVLTKSGYNLQWQATDKSARTWVVQARIKGYWYNLCIAPGGARGIILPQSIMGQADRIAVRGMSACGNSGLAAVMAR